MNHPLAPTPIAQRSWLHRAGILFVVGGILGPLGDYCHVLSQTDGYPEYRWLIPGIGSPLFIVPLFGFAGVAIGMGHAQFGPPVRGSKSWAAVFKSLILLLAIWAASGFLRLETGGLKDVFMAAMAVFMWWMFDRTKLGVLFALVTAVGGTIAEAVQVNHRIFYYYPTVANFWGVPTWLPLLYVSASVAVGNLGKALRDLKPGE